MKKLPRVKDDNLSRSDVRWELYQLWNETRMRFNDHLLNDQRIGMPKDITCPVCERFEGAMVGIGHVIRHFGGSYRR